jgi:hypothetical protein
MAILALACPAWPLPWPSRSGILPSPCSLSASAQTKLPGRLRPTSALPECRSPDRCPGLRHLQAPRPDGWRRIWPRVMPSPDAGAGRSWRRYCRADRVCRSVPACPFRPGRRRSAASSGGRPIHSCSPGVAPQPLLPLGTAVLVSPDRSLAGPGLAAAMPLQPVPLRGRTMDRTNVLPMSFRGAQSGRPASMGRD